MLRDSIHSHRERQDMGTHDEYQDEHLSHGEYFAAHGSCNQEATISKGLHFWVRELEFPNHPSCVGGDQAEETDAE